MITIKDKSKIDPPIEYPCVGESGQGNIVLFSKPCCGILIKLGDDNFILGEYSEQWIMSRFKLHNAEIIIER